VSDRADIFIIGAFQFPFTVMVSTGNASPNTGCIPQSKTLMLNGVPKFF
jgi:hypothetical protein